MDAAAVPHFRNGGPSAAAQTFGARGRHARGDLATMVDVTAGQGTAGGGGFPSFSEIGAILRRGDIALAFGILTILVVLILPLPAIVLDLFLAISITLSVLILMTSLFIQAPLEFSAFPTILLISTMLRLSLNLASTRLILSHGHEGTAAAGHVIEAFGNFVMGGNFVIGIIVFAILVIVNFVVITKGSGRIAEVAARFHLDAMPGKQMAIDADLSAGLIDEKVAKERRKALEDESGFFGAMDGASKFVRGDAVAGLLVVFINVVGGIIIGVAQQGMGFGDAARTYTILTVGDGLVTQVPALIVSTAAGLLVSKAGVSGAADKALMKQLSGYPQALGMSAGVMIVLSLLPGIPMIPFLALGGGAATQIWEGERRFAVVVRLKKPERSLALMRDMLVSTPSGAHIPLSEVAEFKTVGGSMNISRENGSRVLSIGIFIRDRDMGSVVADMQSRVKKNVPLPDGYSVAWSGEFENQQRAMARLAVVVPISFLIVFALLYLALRSVRGALAILLLTPFAMSGGALALIASGINLSVSAAVGFITLLGQVCLASLLVLSAIDDRIATGTPPWRALIDGTCDRLRPVLLTALLAMLGLLPMAMSREIGSETQRPFAVVIIGGLVTALLVTLLALPIVYGRILRLRPGHAEPALEAAP